MRASTRRPLPVALASTRTSTASGPTSAVRPARFGRAAPRARAAALRRRRRPAARHPLDERSPAGRSWCAARSTRTRRLRATRRTGDLLIDTGHPAGLRMVERGGFGDPASPQAGAAGRMRPALGAAAADVAIDTLVRFLGLTGLADAAWVAAHTRLPLPPVQRLVRVTEAVVARSSGLPLPGADRGPGRHARKPARRSRRTAIMSGTDALRRHRAGDAGHQQPQARRYGGAHR
jgi:hypothetical protein